MRPWIFHFFSRLPKVAKGQLPPSAVIGMYEHRRQVEKNIISSHGEASGFFVTFVDNHDQRERFFYSAPDEPLKYADQLTLGVGCLFTLLGIPCLYYGTEQGLHGAGPEDAAIREALWGKEPDAFDSTHPFYQAISNLAAIRKNQPALRYGRQYFRPISGNGSQFGISTFQEGVLAFSRILNNQEVVIVANTSTREGWSGEVIVDMALNPAGSVYKPIFTNKLPSEKGGTPPQPVVDKPAGQVEIYEVNGTISRGPARALPVTLEKMELQILWPVKE